MRNLFDRARNPAANDRIVLGLELAGLALSATMFYRAAEELGPDKICAFVRDGSASAIHTVTGELPGWESSTLRRQIEAADAPHLLDSVAASGMRQQQPPAPESCSIASLY